MNENYEPGKHEAKILDLFQADRDSGGPWGRLNPKYIRSELDIRRQYVNRSLNSLVDAGCIKQLDRGLYEFVGDPRDQPEE